jgi:Glycosyltransferase like family 2
MANEACKDCNEIVKLRKVKDAGWKVACACGDFSNFEPKERATIIVPSRYPDIFESCRDSIDRFAPLENKILVRDGHDIMPPENWKTIQGPEGKFVYSRNINLGLKEATGDVLLCNDDVVFTHRGTIETMQNILDKHPEVGIISPLIDGMVGEYWQGHATQTLHYTDCRLCFVCVLIRKEVVEQIGLLEEFTGYGWDDCDYCRRIVNAGWKMGVTARATVKHGHVDGKWSTSYRRENMSMEAMDKISVAEYKAKWGDDSLGNYDK